MKKKLMSIAIVLGLILSAGAFVVACGGGNNVTLADLEGEWRLERFHISGTTTPTWLSSITFDSEGNFTGVLTIGGGEVTGTATLDGRRIRFNSNLPEKNAWFSTYDYRVRFVGNNMQWDWHSLGSRQNTAFVWNRV